MAGKIPSMCDWTNQGCPQNIERFWRHNQDITSIGLFASLDRVQVNVEDVSAIHAGSHFPANGWRVHPGEILGG